MTSFGSLSLAKYVKFCFGVPLGYASQTLLWNQLFSCLKVTFDLGVNWMKKW